MSLAYGQDSTTIDMVRYYANALDSVLNEVNSIIGYRGELTTIPAVIRVVQGNPQRVKLTWNYDNTGTASEYMIFYIQGEDTAKMVTIFNFQNGTPYSEIWDWWMATSVYNYCYIDLKTDLFPVSYVRLGVVPVSRNKIPDSVKGVRIQ